MRQYFENAKISAVRSLADDLFSAHSNMVDYVYYLVCLCFGILGVKYLSYSYNNKCLVHSSRIRIRMVLPWKRSGFLDRSTGRLIFCAVSLTRMIRQLIPMCFESLKPNGVLARILTVSHPIIERSASAF